jgi:hypothetical protein
LLVFGVSFFALALLFLAAPVIPDADSYYHLAAAREIGSNGYPDGLSWARFSVLGTTFGDKELLFHLFLVPFTRTDPATGGRLALALLNAAIAAAITALTARTMGWWSVLVPLWLAISAPMLTFRLIRLRPELLALLLILALVVAASRKRYVWIAVVCAVFALSYTAFQVAIGLAALWFLIDRDWKVPASAGAGVSAGLLAHPGFPDNLRVWWVQNVEFFLRKAHLDVGTEIGPATTEFVFIGNLGWWAGVALLFFAALRDEENRHRRILLAVAAAAFGVLTLLMQRFAVYFVPLLTLAVVQRPPRPRVAAAFFALSLLSLPATARIVRELLADDPSEAQYAAFARAVPAGAKIAAPWGPAEFYVFFAPHARYLNVLDPVFMSVADPRVYAAQRRVFEGREPDVPRVVKSVLDSDFIAVPSTSPVFERLQNDPRIRPIHSAATFLGRIAEPQPRTFVRDWNGRLHGDYVDARGKANCSRFVRRERIDADVTRIYELASYGPAQLSIGDSLLLRAGPSKAILGAGTAVRVDLSRGSHEFAVTTCRTESGENGFYLVLRGERSGT